ncbi:hypothetical protein FBQ96_04515 [Nitrospirales bacterium NOB]|nr:hypothetical protein [Nitrospirales bacterium NOB]
MAYYAMVCEGKHPIMPIARGPNFRGNWRDGQVITEAVPQPLIYTLDPDYPGSPKAMYYGEAIPVVREDVIEVIRQAGVDNIQYFDAVLRDPSTGKEYRNYKAYNIVGLVACADMQASELMGTSDSTMGDADFHSLVIDETKTEGLLLFRLAENVSAIIVYEKIKQSIENSNIPGFVFYGAGEWSG